MNDVPERGEVLQVVEGVMSGELTREAASGWASERHVQVAVDPAVEDALDILALIDARHVSDQGLPMGYLYDFVELVAARDALRRKDA